MQEQSFGVSEFLDVAIGSTYTYCVLRTGDPRQPGTIQVWQWPSADIGSRQLIASYPVPPGPSYPRIYFSSAFDELWYAWQVDSVCWLCHHGQSPVQLAPCQNSSPCCFGFGYFAWQGAAAEGWPVSRLNLYTQEVVSLVRYGVGTGLARVQYDGHVVTVDEDRFRESGFTNPGYAIGAIVAEDPNGGVAWFAGNRTGLLWPGDVTKTPRVASYAGQIVIGTMGGPSGGRVWTGVRDELPARVAEPIVDVNRELWFGWFEFATPTVIPPGNCLIRTQDQIVRTLAGEDIASYIDAEKEGNTPAAFQVKMDAALRARPRVPVISYRPHTISIIPPGHFTVYEAYGQLSDGSLAGTEARIRRDIAKFAKVWVACQCYTSNKDNTTDLAGLVAVYARIFRDCGNIIGALVFSDAGRDTGLTSHEEVRPLWAKLASTIRTPRIQLLPPVVVPPVDPPDNPDDDEGEDMPARIPSDKFDAWLNAATPYAVELYGVSSVEAEQSVREMGDRIRGGGYQDMARGRDCTLWELLTSPGFRMRMPPAKPWPAASLDELYIRVSETERGLPR